MKLGDASYAAIAQHCTQLQELRLYASMPSARAVLGFSALKQLQLVDICGAHQVTGMPQYSIPGNEHGIHANSGLPTYTWHCMASMLVQTVHRAAP